MSDEDKNSELLRLRGLGEWMREIGATELELGDVRIKLAPKPPAAPGMVRSADERAVDEIRALREEERAAREGDSEEALHKEFWRRVTRSSGAPIPPFKRRETAQ